MKAFCGWPNLFLSGKFKWKVVDKKIAAMLRKVSFILIFLVLGGCASQVPFLIRQPPPENPSFTAVQKDISRYQGSHVRWGGTIANVQNKKETTVIEIVARELGKDGRPKQTDVSPGRFWAHVDHFLDPVIYKREREITVYGTVEKLGKGHIGEHPYLFPVVQVNTYYLWAPIETEHYYYPPYYYAPYGYYGFYPFWYFWY